MNGNSEKEQNLVIIMTKTALLSCFSSSTLMLTWIILPFSIFFPSPHLRFVFAMSILLDLLTNFLTILLSYQYFNTFYYKLCGKCHHYCYDLCNNSIGNTKDVQMMKKEAQTSSHFSTTISDTTVTELEMKSDEDKPEICMKEQTHPRVQGHAHTDNL